MVAFISPFGLSLNAIAIALFYGSILYLIYRNWHKIEFQSIFLMYRSKHGLKIIESVARFKRFWRGFAYVTVPIAYIGMVTMFGMLIKLLIDTVKTAGASPAVSIIIPGVKVPGSDIFLPFWYGMISIILLVLVHEGAHGILARAHNIPVKNTGVGMALILPFAFVEPDEKVLKKKPFHVKAAVFGAGSMANFLLAGVAILLGIYLIFPAATATTQFSGIEINELTDGFPAGDSGLAIGDLITSINGVQIDSAKVIIDEMDKLDPGDTVRLGVDGEEITFETKANPNDDSKAYMGISFIPNIDLKPDIVSRFGKFPWVIVWFAKLLTWIFIVNIGVGLFNLLPLGFVDGGRMSQLALQRFVPNKRLAHSLFVYISLVALALLLINIFSPLIF